MESQIYAPMKYGYKNESKLRKANRPRLEYKNILGNLVIFKAKPDEQKFIHANKKPIAGRAVVELA